MEAKVTCCAATEVCGDQKACNCKAGSEWACEIVKMEAEQLQEGSKPFYKCTEDSSCCCTIVEEGYSVKKEVTGASAAFCHCEEGYSCSFIKKEGPNAGKKVFECGNGCICEIDGDQVKVLYTAAN